MTSLQALGLVVDSIDSIGLLAKVWRLEIDIY